MKSISLILCLFAATILSLAQEVKNGLIVGADVRIVAGKSIDFTKANAWVKEYLELSSIRNKSTKWDHSLDAKEQALEKQREEIKPIELFIHKVFAVTKDGLLCEDGDRYVFLKNFPGVVVDGDYVTCLAVPDGIYRYKTAIGGVSTVRCYDFGVAEKQ